jgi:GWxTD domain-containing protein
MNARLVAALAVIATTSLCGCATNREALVECYYITQSLQRSLPTCETFTLSVNPKEGRGIDSLRSRLDVYVQTLYSRIRFEKNLDVFKGSYTASFVVWDENETIVRTEDVERSLLAVSYSETVSSRCDAFLHPILLPPGRYTLDVTIADNGSGLRRRIREKVEVKSFPKERFSVSDYLFFESAQRDQKGILLRPMFPSELSFVRDSVGIFQEMYNVQRGDTVRLSFSYACARREGLDDNTPKSLYAPYRLRSSQCIRPLDSTYYRSDSVFVAGKSGTVQVFQYFPKPAEGVSSITRRVHRLRNGSSDSSVHNIKIPIHASSFPRLSTFDDVIAALAYIARSQELDSVRAAGTPLERRNRINKFWLNHGGEIRQREFGERILEANELFSSCMEGWQTPMGITYIVCGPPDYVECQGLINEVWYYDLGGNRGLAVPFRQNLENEIGRYYEIVPFSVNDFLWQQFVDRWRRQ